MWCNNICGQCEYCEDEITSMCDHMNVPFNDVWYNIEFNPLTHKINHELYRNPNCVVQYYIIHWNDNYYLHIKNKSNEHHFYEKIINPLTIFEYCTKMARFRVFMSNLFENLDLNELNDLTDDNYNDIDNYIENLFV